ncbi:Predicted membrane protein [Edwardsiella tarda]|nr:Predicted membrane protein [Edwardsiella tarda]
MSDTMHDDVRTAAPRIATLDALRGLALLGILLMNIVGFALPKAAYLNPAYQGMPSAGDQVAWLLSSLLVQGKFLALFALLFGAGLEMLLPRGAIWIQTRLGWLVLFGLLHTLVLWDGDILLAYGLIGLVSWRMIRDAGSVRTLFNSGVTLYAIGLGMLLLLALLAKSEPHAFWHMSYAEIQYETYWKLEGGWAAWRNRGDLLADNLLALAVQYGWQLAGLMALGAALMRSGWLRGRFSSTHYRRVGVSLFLLGVAIQLPTSLLQWHLQWAYRWCGYLLQLPGELARH